MKCAIASPVLAVQGKRTVDDFHKALGKIIWGQCGMARNEAGLQQALRDIPALREEFWRDVRVLGSGENLNSRWRRRGESPTSSSSAS